MLMTARMTNPVFVLDGAMDAMQALAKSVSRARMPIDSELVHLRASQINGCSVCVDMHAKALRKAGESEERVFAVSAWREAPFFSDAERAALALTEAGTRLADDPDAVSDEIWDEAARHYNDAQLMSLVVQIATINAFNRMNAMTRQLSGDWVGQLVQKAA
jgi:AhpD family alkylhydroperoxidase